LLIAMLSLSLCVKVTPSVTPTSSNRVQSGQVNATEKISDNKTPANYAEASQAELKEFKEKVRFWRRVNRDRKAPKAFSNNTHHKKDHKEAERKVTTEQSLAQGCIQVFDDCAYGGASKVFCMSDSDNGRVSDLGTWRNSIASIKVGPDTKVLLYEGIMYSFYTGFEIEIYENTYCLWTDTRYNYHEMNDNAASLIIMPPCYVKFYRDCGYNAGGSPNGVSERYSGGMTYFPFNIGYGMDEDVASFRVGKRTEIQLFTGQDWTGDASTWIPGSFCLWTDPALQWINDRARSFKLRCW